MIYAMVAIAVVLVLGWGTIKFEHWQNTRLQAQVKSEQVRAKSAEDANAALAKSCRDATKKLQDAEARRQKASKDALAKAAQKDAVQKAEIERLRGLASNTTQLPPDQDCAAAREILRSYVKEMTK